jgi:hypothetical protein
MRQLESGGTFTRSLNETSSSIGEALLRIGVSTRSELRLGLNSYSLTRSAGITNRGFEDVSLGAKFKLLDGGGDGSAKPAVAVIVASSFPTGAEPFRAGGPQPEAKLGVSWDLSSRVAFSSNLNYALVREQSEKYGEVAASGSLGVGLTSRLGSYLEYFTFLPQSEHLSSSRYLNGGLTYGLTPNLQLDARGGLGLKKLGGPDYFVGFGFARRW